MPDTTFKAFWIEESEPKKYSQSIIERSTDELPDGDVLIQVHYSSLNYKDALSSVGNKGVTRKFPHTPGIDAAGVVAESSSDNFKVGDEVIVTGYDLGMNTSGGLGQYIRVPSDWVVSKPEGLSFKEAMIYGTAGFTAGLMVRSLINHGVTPDQGEILVTGSTGGVGSVAVAILGKLGFNVVAATGKMEEETFLKKLGATSVVDRNEIIDEAGRPMLKEQWAGVVDVVGGKTLATAIASTKRAGVVTCAGLVESIDLNTSVFPFILRGVSLLGIDSAEINMPPRLEVWGKLAEEWKVNLTDLVQEIKLQDVGEKVGLMLKGKLKGRTVVDVLNS